MTTTASKPVQKRGRIALRLPKDLDHKLRTSAIEHGITLNDEIMLRLQDSFVSRNAPRAPRRADQTITISVPEAGKRYFGLGRNASYAAAERGELPTVKIGKKLRVPIDALERKLERGALR